MQHILEQVTAEVNRAKIKHPNWPSDTIDAAAIVCEESGELIRAALQHKYEGGSIEAMQMEAIQTAATCIRFLEGLQNVKLITLYFTTMYDRRDLPWWNSSQLVKVIASNENEAVKEVEKAYGNKWDAFHYESEINILDYRGGVIATINTITA